jgi:prolyl-tRNA synthetase
MIMTHGDDDGMIMPPRVAPYHVVVIPITRDEADTPKIMAYADDLRKRLKAQGLRVHVDGRDERTPNKMWDAIKKGVPLRVEIGGREVDEGTLTYIRRDLGKDSKKTVSVEEFAGTAQGVLDAMQADMLARARALRDARIHEKAFLAEAEEHFKGGGTGFLKIDTRLLEEPGFEALKGAYSLTTRCMPLEDGGQTVLVGRAY